MDGRVLSELNDRGDLIVSLALPELQLRTALAAGRGGFAEGAQRLAELDPGDFGDRVPLIGGFQGPLSRDSSRMRQAVSITWV